ncbi:hypothetical protein GCM10010478_61390 [Streptomyces erythrogriseus]|uniref:Uncharacterized protein n=4 Tax=Streptomyces TaxID=1883 RepID=A0ABP7XRP6_9ACTN|nr:hypothetical protein GCM10010265_11860 [Streptomyces griseoincarnatus]GGT68124.1 hypothetical protein GCM10010287_48530 [Streptomyces variabilis]
MSTLHLSEWTAGPVVARGPYRRTLHRRYLNPFTGPGAPSPRAPSYCWNAPGCVCSRTATYCWRTA